MYRKPPARFCSSIRGNGQRESWRKGAPIHKAEQHDKLTKQKEGETEKMKKEEKMKEEEQTQESPERLRVQKEE